MNSFLFLCLLCLSLLTIHYGVSREIECIPSERDTLLKFKTHLFDPSNRLSSWNLSLISNCCQWPGVVCDINTSHVAELHLSTDDFQLDSDAYNGSMFGGEINRCLVDLKHLNYLDFSGNYIGAGMPIPSFLLTMTSLTHLNLSNAGFMGMIPPQIGNLSNLMYLDLRYVANGTIPSQIGNLSNLVYLDLRSESLFAGTLYAENVEWLSSMSKLEYLDLGSVDLSKSFDWLHKLQALPSLKHLHLSQCSLPLNYNQPSSLNFSSLLTLDMSSDNYPSVPKWIFGLKKLVSLQLSSNEIQGAIPDGIQNLTLLEYLDLSYNSFSSSIPHCLYGLHHLNFLDLRGNNLNGTISETLGNLTSLVQLHLSENQLEGTIPTSLGNLTSLLQLHLFRNQLEGTIPTSLGNLTSLLQLHSSYNQLEGTIPASLGNLTALVQLDLSFNQLEGTIPTSLGNLTSLVQLDLSFNHFVGKLPTSLGILCNLMEIDFSGLKLNQQVSEILEILAPCISHGLTHLAVSSSQLSGNLTDQFGAFNNIIELDFSSNSIGGTLPTSFGKLSSLTFLDLSNNRFNGNPFESIRSLSQLSDFYISHNHFQAVVKEDDLANLTRLDNFRASGNNFTLKVSPNWHPNFQLFYLDMTAWQLGPKFPSWIQFQNNLKYLEMSNTGISVSIPTWFWEEFPEASYLNLSHNHINGELSKSLPNSISWELIDLSSNQLHGKLPHLSVTVIWLDLSSNYFSESMTDFLCNKQFKRFELQFLNLASNNLSGKIPDCWMKWPNLYDVNIQSNHFVGNLPPSMGSLAQLQSLNIRNSSLSGMFPTVLKKNSQLISLDLGENYLSGAIPTWLGKSFLYMRILRLRSNNFSGHIPNEICHMRFLQDLDLAQNSLSGRIPNCFNHFNAMLLKNKSTNLFIYSDASAVGTSGSISILLWLKGRAVEYNSILGLVTNVDLSNNKLSGGIPREITDLDGLIYLNLSNNQLSGQIPSSIGNMRSLESIDMSRNQLSGEIPSTITNLSFLNKLEVSYNHLKGKIPTGTQMQSFEASNFVGNNLCGPPLPINCSASQQIPHTDHIGTENDGQHRMNWLFVSMALGFIVGFWAVVAPLFIYRSWRYAYYRFLDDMWYKLQSYW